MNEWDMVNVFKFYKNAVYIIKSSPELRSERHLLVSLIILRMQTGMSSHAFLMWNWIQLTLLSERMFALGKKNIFV